MGKKYSKREKKRLSLKRKGAAAVATSATNNNAPDAVNENITSTAATDAAATSANNNETIPNTTTTTAFINKRDELQHKAEQLAAVAIVRAAEAQVEILDTEGAKKDADDAAAAAKQAASDVEEFDLASSIDGSDSEDDNCKLPAKLSPTTKRKSTDEPSLRNNNNPTAAASSKQSSTTTIIVHGNDNLIIEPSPTATQKSNDATSTNNNNNLQCAAPIGESTDDASTYTTPAAARSTPTTTTTTNNNNNIDDTNTHNNLSKTPSAEDIEKAKDIAIERITGKRSKQRKATSTNNNDTTIPQPPTNIDTTTTNNDDTEQCVQLFYTKYDTTSQKSILHSILTDQRAKDILPPYVRPPTNVAVTDTSRLEYNNQLIDISDPSKFRPLDKTAFDFYTPNKHGGRHRSLDKDGNLRTDINLQRAASRSCLHYAHSIKDHIMGLKLSDEQRRSAFWKALSLPGLCDMIQSYGLTTKSMNIGLLIANNLQRYVDYARSGTNNRYGRGSDASRAESS